MFKNIQYATANRKDHNIDVIQVKSNIAWVIDGANSLFPLHVTEEESDAKWFVKELHQYLKEHVQAECKPLQLLYHAQESIMNKFAAKCQEEPVDMEYPNISFAMVYAHQNQLFYYIIGPCEIAIRLNNGKVYRMSDMRLPILDAKLMCVCQSARRKQRIPLFQARAFMEHMMVENRLHRNMENWYYVFGEDQASLDHCITGVFPLDQIQSISLLCFGFEEYYHPIQVQSNLEDYLFKKRNAKLVEGYERALKKQEDNVHLARYVQEQVSKPSTHVSFEVAKQSIQ